MLIPLISILSSVIITAVASWFLTYGAQKTKIRQMKQDGLTAIRDAREVYFNKGFDAGVAHEKKQYAKVVEDQYLNGYNDGLANERYMTPSNGKHRYTGDDITAMHPAYPTPTAGVEGIETLIGDEPTSVYQTT